VMQNLDLHHDCTATEAAAAAAALHISKSK
jgi:hypothetical protein